MGINFVGQEPTESDIRNRIIRLRVEADKYNYGEPLSQMMLDDINKEIRKLEGMSVEEFRRLYGTSNTNNPPPPISRTGDAPLRPSTSPTISRYEYGQDEWGRCTTRIIDELCPVCGSSVQGFDFCVQCCGWERS